MADNLEFYMLCWEFIPILRVLKMLQSYKVLILNVQMSNHSVYHISMCNSSRFGVVVTVPVVGEVMCVQEARILWVSEFALYSGLRGTERKWLRLWGCVWLWAKQGRLRRDDFRLFSFNISLILVCMPAEKKIKPPSKLGSKKNIP